MSKILLSICIPTYNRPENIRIILESFTVYPNNELEIVISDDNVNSNENTDVIKDFTDPRIKYFRNELNLNFGANILKSIERAKGEFIYGVVIVKPEYRSYFPFIRRSAL